MVLIKNQFQYSHSINEIMFLPSITSYCSCIIRTTEQDVLCYTVKSFLVVLVQTLLPNHCYKDDIRQFFF